MDIMDFSIHYVLLILTLCVNVVITHDYRAHLGDRLLLQRVKRQSKPAKPVLKVTEYHVRCSVLSRYAVTRIQSSVWNQLSSTKEAAFEVDLPSAAFISNFTITSNGKVYVAQVKERAAARKIYDAAKKQGRTAGLVATKEREIERFRVAVSAPPGVRLSFCLTYEELLLRRLGRYELSLGLRPGQPVENLTVEVTVSEKTELSFIRVLPLKTSRLINNAHGEGEPPPSTLIEKTSHCARVLYSPSVEQQTSVSAQGINADFILQYDVELRDIMGDIQVYDGYFVHYFAPRGLPVVPKDVIFVIDISGSMIGTKIKQTKQAMSTILGDLREGDHFNIITFSDRVQTWKKGRTVRATRQNVRDAKEFVKRISAEGWTNINAALLSAAQLVNPLSTSSPSRRVPLVIFLTDGEATIGVTASDTILINAKKALGSASLFGLAFGDDADFLLLKRLALDNRGVARMVYEDADAALQLKGFYDEVASPLLSDIQLTYLDEQAFDVTCSLFPNYFQGSELVVAGRVKPGVKDFKVALSAVDSKQRVKYENDVLISGLQENNSFDGCVGDVEGMSSFVNRLWAYSTIKELLLAKLNATDPSMQRLLADKATNLSLKYNFVTPLTSLVVVKPDEEASPTTEKPTTTPATITTTATTLTTAKIIKNSNVIKQNKTKPEPPKPPPVPLKKTTAPNVKITRKTTTTASPDLTKTNPAGILARKPTVPNQNVSKIASPPPLPAGKISTSVLNALKTALPPAPGKVSTTTHSNIVTTSVLTTNTVTQAISTSKMDPKMATTQPTTTTTTTTTAITTLPPTKVTVLPIGIINNNITESMNGQELVTVTALPQLVPPLISSSIDPVLDAANHSNSNYNTEEDITIATLISATFAPMPGVPDGSRPWEAAGELLDVSTSIQVQRKDIDLDKDYDATYDYDYNLNYDPWDDTDTDTDTSFGKTSQLGTVRVFSSSVDGDPHFVLQLPKLHESLCFTVDGRAKDVLRLLEDPDKGIIVDGHLVGAPSKPGAEDRSRTYFDRLVIAMSTGGSADILISVSLDSVVLEGEGRDKLPVNQQGSIRRQEVTVTVDNHHSCWIELSRNVCFLVLFHYYKHPSYLQMAHLGFYITNGQGLSHNTQGLLGQFQHTDMTVTRLKNHQEANANANRSSPKEPTVSRGILRWGQQHMRVTLQDKTFKDSVQRRHSGKCWVVPKAEVERLLGHPYESYVVDHV
ncbi:inter-alpha-trypsin inhibitor heavy chain H6 [Boleophthalmus pectinirostris]|uniref:inter-alpha-trypsin inhibitor heavy chain H6 n=1 Tax=Boleophthalmus pectinirostris TaxID=150288 RepID=UPI00242D7B46|nr:inter-alpha-trypsin inhibitor heavy chain H6 [Boleophthalmus pectinirostris]